MTLLLYITCYYKDPTEGIMKILMNNQFIRFELFELTFDLLLNLPSAKSEPIFLSKSQAYCIDKSLKNNKATL